MGERRYIATILRLSTIWRCGQLHDLTTLLLGEKPLVPTGWAPEPVLMLWRKEKSCPCWESNPSCPAYSLSLHCLCYRTAMHIKIVDKYKIKASWLYVSQLFSSTVMKLCFVLPETPKHMYDTYVKKKKQTSQLHCNALIR
jgi:hypothetical protein